MLAALLVALLSSGIGAAESWPPLLNLPGAGDDSTALDFASLPVLKGKHAVVCALEEQWKFQLHNYLVYRDGRFWCMWSHGPVVEDVPTQHVRYATSEDGLHWSASKPLTGPPAEGRAYIARGFWERDGELLALAAYYKGKGAFGVDKDLRLQAFEWDNASSTWKPKGLVFENAINNFTPQKLSTGAWMMTRRDSRFNVSMLIGGIKSIDDWRVHPVLQRNALKGFSPDEPIWWEQPDGRLVAIFRDNGGSGRLFRALSTDHGETWSVPEKTSYPNATSKVFSLRTSRGFRVLISNANPAPGVGRREMHLGISDDGWSFNRLGRLEIPLSAKPATFQYPHAVEHEGYLFIAFSRNKNTTELLRLSLDEIQALLAKP